VKAAAGRSPDTAVFADGRLYVTSNITHEILVLDPKVGKPVGNPIPVPPNPFAIVADDRWLWVTGVGEHTLSRIAYR
jgi:streptogramin lyase